MKQDGNSIFWEVCHNEITERGEIPFTLKIQKGLQMTTFTMAQIISNLDRATLITKGLGVEKRGMYIQLAEEADTYLSQLKNCLMF